MNKSTSEAPYDSARWVSMRIDPAVHKALRHYAADKDKSVSAVIKDAISLHIKDKAAR